MTKLSASLVVKIFTVLLMASLFLVSCAPSIAVFIENKTSDNFRIGGAQGRHVKPGQVVFYTNLDNDNVNLALVELWRSYGCITVLKLSVIAEVTDNLQRTVVTVTESDTYDPVYTATSSHFAIDASTLPCT